MPFTPFHIGPAVAVKAAFPKKFSLLIFAWAQIVMDLQPLVVILTGRGRSHGVTHTLVGAAVLGIAAGVSGKYLTEWVLSWQKNKPRVTLSWRETLFSAWLGTFSHVVIDALVYPDMDLFWPFVIGNPLRIGFSMRGMVTFCVVSGGLGTLMWVIIIISQRLKQQRKSGDGLREPSGNDNNYD
jgi:membrane-bound metal-dependent hydrolase YbcI (DUF457 family)